MIQLGGLTTFASNVVEESLNCVEAPIYFKKWSIYLEKRRYIAKNRTLQEKYVRELRHADFADVQVLAYDVIDYYETPEDLIFLLKHTPIIPRFGETKEDFDMLQTFIAANTTEKGIRTNSKRFMIIASKS